MVFIPAVTGVPAYQPQRQCLLLRECKSSDFFWLGVHFRTRLSVFVVPAPGFVLGKSEKNVVFSAAAAADFCRS